MTSLRALIAICAMMFSLAAAAQEIPEIDPMAICQRQVEATDQGAWLLNACLQQEQKSYDAIKAAWPSIDAKTIRVCSDQVIAVDQGYLLLKACIDQEIKSKTAVEQFQFKR